MGYRKVPTIYTLKFDKYPDLQVRLKGLRLGAMRRLIALGDNELNSHLDEIIGMLAGAAVSWNLEDEDGREIPFNAQSLDDMELEFLMDIFNAWTDQLMGVDDDLGKGSNSGATSPVPLPTMEAL